MNEIQYKLISAARLLLEARALAKANIDEMRKDDTRNRPQERRVDDVIYALKSNCSITIEGLIDLAERANIDLLTSEGDVELLEKDLNWVFRRNKNFLEGARSID